MRPPSPALRAARRRECYGRGRARVGGGPGGSAGTPVWRTVSRAEVLDVARDPRTGEGRADSVTSDGGGPGYAARITAIIGMSRAPRHSVVPVPAYFLRSRCHQADLTRSGPPARRRAGSARRRPRRSGRRRRGARSRPPHDPDVTAVDELGMGSLEAQRPAFVDVTVAVDDEVVADIGTRARPCDVDEALPPQGDRGWRTSSAANRWCEKTRTYSVAVVSRTGSTPRQARADGVALGSCDGTGAPSLTFRPDAYQEPRLVAVLSRADVSVGNRMRCQ